jgi:hypothetical protein
MNSTIKKGSSAMSIYTPQEKFAEKYPDIDLSTYFEFIKDNSLPKKIKHKTSCHHILPKWAFPEYESLKDNKWNEAILEYKNHLNAHIILAKIWSVHENTFTVFMMSKISYMPEIEDSILDMYNSVMVANSIHIENIIKEGNHNLQSDYIKQINRERNLSNIADGTHNWSPQVMFDKFGVTNIMHIEEVKEKVMLSKENTLLERYGVTCNFDIDGVRMELADKRRENWLETLGVEHPMQLEENRLIASERLKINNPMHRDDVKENLAITNTEKFGSISPFGNKDVLQKALNTRKERSLTRPKEKWYKHDILRYNAKARIGTELEMFLFSKGFVYGRKYEYRNLLKGEITSPTLYL